MMRIRVDQGKCTGCQHCEAACSMKHYVNEVNPKKSRIRVFTDDEEQRSFPVIAGPTTSTECTSKFDVVIGGTEYDDSTLCRASCPSRPWFVEPDTGVALKCDFCGDPPDPHCVKVCESGALSVVEV